MEEIDIEICPNEISKYWDNIKKLSKSHENITMKIFIYIASCAKLNFGDVEDKKSEFHASKHPIHIDKADI